MSRLVVLGAGGHGRVVADAASRSARFDSIVFLDNDPGRDTSETGFPIVGTCDELESITRPGDSCIVGIGDNEDRARLIRRIEELGLELAVVVDPSAAVSRGCHLEGGTVVLPQSAVNTGAFVGRGCIINTGATIDHDCRLGSFVHVSPGAHLGGNVVVGNRTWIGIGASVRHGIELGEDVMVGAGAAVVSDVESGATVVGVPARPIES